MYVYEIGPRYFYHATTSPEMWTHIFLNYHHSFTPSFFFFLKLLIIHPKEYSFHFFQHRQKLFHFRLLFNFFLLYHPKRRIVERKTREHPDPSPSSSRQISRVESVITNRYEIIRRRKVNARVGVYTTAMVISFSPGPGVERRAMRAAASPKSHVTSGDEEKRDASPTFIIMCATFNEKRNVFYVHAHAHASPSLRFVNTRE